MLDVRLEQQVAKQAEDTWKPDNPLNRNSALFEDHQITMKSSRSVGLSESVW